MSARLFLRPLCSASLAFAHFNVASKAPTGHPKCPHRHQAFGVLSLVSLPYARLSGTLARCSRSAAMDEEFVKPLSRILWESCQKEAMAALHHPFVVGMAANTLPVETFQHYVAQDAYFLSAFSKAYDLAQDLVGDDYDAKRVLKEQMEAAERELQLHGSYALAWGVDLEKYGAPSTATLAYTSFLLETAGQVSNNGAISESESKKVSNASQMGFSVNTDEETDEDSGGSVVTGDAHLKSFLSPDGNVSEGDEVATVRATGAAQIIAAMVPCMRLYAFLGQELKRALQTLKISKDDKNQYEEWVETYASPGFEASAVQLENLLDRLGKRVSTEAKNDLLKLYKRAMELEVNFFSAQPMPEQMKNKSFLRQGWELSTGKKERNLCIFASDFDSTCTSEDSSELIAELAFIVKEGENTEKSGLEERKRQWEEIATRYVEDYKTVVNNCLLSDRTDAGFDERVGAVKDRLRWTLEKLSEFEMEANEKVEASRVLRGISKDNIVSRGRQLSLQRGCGEVLEALQKMDVLVNIVSVAWSRSFIYGALMEALGEDNIAGISIQSNELEFNSNDTSTGKVIWSVQTAIDKEKVFTELCHPIDGVVTAEKVGQRRYSQSATKQKLKSIFVGDSITDILAILAADVGIVLGENSTLQKVASDNNIQLCPLLCASIVALATDSGRSLDVGSTRYFCYKAKNWEEIGAFLGV